MKFRFKGCCLFSSFSPWEGVVSNVTDVSVSPGHWTLGGGWWWWGHILS